MVKWIECLLGNVNAKQSIHLRQNQLTALREDQMIGLDFLQSDVLESLTESLFAWQTLSLDEAFE